ncbi:unnamed protein product [Adineta steineri]|uniref:Phenylalanine ammonia-lyase n=1 Tax=Adineta steineri TaxID=433720 RepID=A0A813VNM9_9BILA|nr:unnamed protein product [Adineta steineri]CAF0848488.1 unnamed protein product [Adineta steineri]
MIHTEFHSSHLYPMEARKNVHDKQRLEPVIVIRGQGLTLEHAVQVSRRYRQVKLTDDTNVCTRMDQSVDVLEEVVKAALPLYGVTTLFGGLATEVVSNDVATELQNNLVRVHTAGAGPIMPLESIRAAMLLRANTHLIGASGIRRQWDEKLIRFLNEEVTPLVPVFGSIGASGDLIPLSYIASAISGQDEHVKVDFKGETISAPEALQKLGLNIEKFNPKEGLAMINGTSVMTASATLAAYDLYTLMAASLHIHAMAFQALAANNQPLHPFFYQVRSHPGQIEVTDALLELINGSKMIYNGLDGKLTKRSEDEPIQDRYSIRCCPQFLGPMVETMHDISRTIEIEINCANDNPLIDVNTRKIYCGGNFLGEHVSIAMDRLRQTVGLMAKHLDVQIAQLVTPEFNNGLPACLVGNQNREVNLGVKALQICGNSIMPYLLFLGTPMADKFPTHAEQYNQNINSMGHMSACLAHQSIATFRQHLSICLLICVQALDLRANKITKNNYDARSLLSDKSRTVYEAVRSIINVPIDEKRSYIWNDGEHALDKHIALISENLTMNEDGPLFKAIEPTIVWLRSKRYSNEARRMP